MRLDRALLVAAAAGLMACAFWWRRHPSACPFGQRFWAEPPHPFITRRRGRTPGYFASFRLANPKNSLYP